MAASASNQLETKLNDLFGKSAPQMPENGRKMLVEWAPWVALVVGILSLVLAFTLWNGARYVSSALDYANSVCSVYGGYGCNTVATESNLTLWVWLGIAVLLVEGVLYLLAFPGLRAQKKAGWNYLYWGALVNLVYAVVSLFTSYDPLTHFIGALIGSAIGLWILFQIRGLYMGERSSKNTTAK